MIAQRARRDVAQLLISHGATVAPGGYWRLPLDGAPGALLVSCPVLGTRRTVVTIDRTAGHPAPVEAEWWFVEHVLPIVEAAPWTAGPTGTHATLPTAEAPAVLARWIPLELAWQRSAAAACQVCEETS